MAKTPEIPPSKDDHAQNALFREVEDDLRHEQIMALWTRYGKFAIGAAIAVVVVVAGYQGWQTWKDKLRAEQAAQLEAAIALTVEKKPVEAQAALAALSRDGQGAFASLATLRLAALKQEQGDRSGALALYDALAADSNADQALRDAATLLSVMAGLDGGDPALLNARLEPFLADNNPWRFTAWEMAAVLALNGGDDATAASLLKRIVDDQAAPTGARSRASRLLEGAHDELAPAGDARAQ